MADRVQLSARLTHHGGHRVAITVPDLPGRRRPAVQDIYKLVSCGEHGDAGRAYNGYIGATHGRQHRYLGGTDPGAGLQHPRARTQILAGPPYVLLRRRLSQDGDLIW